MRKIETQIEINAPIENVWNVLMDHDEYPNWNPFIKKISGSTALGDKFSATIQNEGSKPMTFIPLVLVNQPNQEFRWKGKLFVKGLFDGEHYFILEKINATKTRFLHGEHFTGILKGLVLKMIEADTLKGFEAMNLALKLRIESI